MSGYRDATAVWLTLLRHLSAAAVVALFVASIDWGGLDRGLMDRVAAGLWSLLAATSLGDAVISHRLGLPRAHVAYLLTGCAGASCMVIAQLSHGALSAAFFAAAGAFIGASLVAVRRYKRDVEQQVLAGHAAR